MRAQWAETDDAPPRPSPAPRTVNVELPLAGHCTGVGANVMAPAVRDVHRPVVSTVALGAHVAARHVGEAAAMEGQVEETTMVEV